MARAAYYDVLSTPSTLFNGKRAAGHGGPAQDALKKFNQYRFVIDDMLKNTRAASIKLKARRAGEQVRITAEAEISTEGEKSPARSPRLRLVLVEDEVAYPGGNRQSIHRHVVRAFPGGAQGTLLEGGKGRVETSFSLDRLRESQSAYLQAYPASPGARGKFPRSLPPIALDRLSVVAIVQDDHDRSVLHAVVVPLEGVKASKEQENSPR